MLQCVFLLSDSGEVMVEKQMTAHRVDRGICGWFWDYVLAHAAGDASKVLQVVVSPTHYLFQVYRNGVTFLACTQVEMPPLLAIEV
jgi:AP-3 complex subunit mu